MSLNERLLQLKRDIASSYPDFERNATSAWDEVLQELAKTTQEIGQQGSSYLPIVEYDKLSSLPWDKVNELKRKGSFVVRGVVPVEEARAYKTDLETFVSANPSVEGTPASDPQYFQIFYSKSQLLARAHPNVLDVQTWCNHLYDAESTTETADLSKPLTYVDRFRIRRPGFAWGAHPPHMDGGSIERWQDPTFRSCFEKILSGDWATYDPYTLKGRIGARSSANGLPNQASIFRTFQGWLALSDTGPGEGTLQVFPDVVLSTAYIMLRPFFSCTADPEGELALKAENWKFGKPPRVTTLNRAQLRLDIENPTFHGVSQDASAGKAGGARPFEFSHKTHPHMMLDETMISVPQVHPGDMVFWHCDVVHAVEKEHSGEGDSSVMYIPAVPTCEQNKQYVRKQADSFEKGLPPPDFPQGRSELDYNLIGRPEDITLPLGRRAMGLAS